MAWRRRQWLVVLGVALAGCKSYPPHPLTPETSLVAYGERSLSTPRIESALARAEPQRHREWPLHRWDLTDLTVAALELSPELAVVRADLLVAEAGIRTAATRPNPTLTVVPENAVPAGPSPWIAGAMLDIPIETAGKRRKRMDIADRATQSALWAWVDAAWQVRSRVRAALVEHVSAQRERVVLLREAALRAELLHFAERKRDGGEASLLDVAAARADHLASMLAVQAVESRAATTRSTLARAVGIPVSALADVEVEWTGFEAPSTVEPLTDRALQTVALLNRADVLRSLADYEATEAALRLEIARQYPDVHLNPGYQWDQGVSKYAFGVSMTLPLLDQNQGPIGEAAARRAAAEARFLALQARVVGETESALAAVHGAWSGLAAADEVAREAQRHRGRIQRALDLGESDRLALAAAEVQEVVFARSRVIAGRDAQVALGALEDALQHPVEGELSWQPHRGNPSTAHQ